MSIIITVSRQLGAGGTQIASKVANMLDLRLVDRQILDRVAEQAGVPAGVVEAVDESPAAAKKRPKGTRMEATDQTYNQLMQAAIHDYARQGNALIVGRGAHLLLSGRPDLLRVKVLAPREVRINSLMQRLNLSRAAAERAVRDSDSNRAAFIKTVYKADWMDPSLYDLVINTKSLDYDTASEVIALVARKMQEKQT
ncbi:MAG: cytidylate kinase-like family protein [Anaerolineae bacterium]